MGIYGSILYTSHACTDGAQPDFACLRMYIADDATLFGTTKDTPKTYEKAGDAVVLTEPDDIH